MRNIHWRRRGCQKHVMLLLLWNVRLSASRIFVDICTLQAGAGRLGDFFARLVGAHEALQVSGIDHTTVDFELGERVINLRCRELVSEGHERVSERLSIDLTADLKGLKGLEDGLVVIGAAGHFAREQSHHLREVHRSIGLVKHRLCLSAGDGLAVVGEGSGQVRRGQQTVLVHIHDAERLLELLDGGVGERVEDVGFLGHGGKVEGLKVLL